jgi:hypothetical protein
MIADPDEAFEGLMEGATTLVAPFRFSLRPVPTLGEFFPRLVHAPTDTASYEAHGIQSTLILLPVVAPEWHWYWHWHWH